MSTSINKNWVLDVGCGGNQPHQITRGNLNLDVQKPRFKVQNFVLADAHYLPFKSSCVSRVFLFDLMQYFVSPYQCVCEAYRVLTHEGQVIISTQNPVHWRRVLRAIFGKSVTIGNWNGETWTDQHIQCWTEAEMRLLLHKVGFKQTKVYYKILPARGQDTRTHIRLDKFVQHIVSKPLAGRNMITTAWK
jgi:ubiquinone/menaquinone biosynthesis C-methylase UbiE